MSFPFLPGGLILAAAVLIGALTAFRLLLGAIDRTIAGVRNTAVPGIVAGFRMWGSRQPSPAGMAGSPARPWSLAGMEGWPIAPLPAPDRHVSVPGDATWQAELIDLGTRRIDPREHSGR